MPGATSPNSAVPDARVDLADLMEEEIVLGLRYPRERLVEDELMSRFAAKRHAVRQALHDLENRGLVERRPHVGAFVRAYTAKDVRDLYDVRELLEVHCARLIALPADPARIAELIDVQRRHDTAVEHGDLRAVVKANMTFHQLLFALSDNAVLVEAIRRHAQIAHAIRSVTVTEPDFLQRSRTEHWTMIRALQDQDSDLLAEMCRAHLLPSRDAYLRRVLDITPGPSAGRPPQR
ncbi:MULTISPECIES: GntR family transcriptional regulator [Actinoalloteichus]|uniref:Transcriptional regulator n=1 Tax=Actinoalloteichus fjordicus TaxID=1612552 RepID=A0AAC9LAH6_9PSEU|nr:MULTISPECIES: GntR family transcriptional regulator [Actinoalloteichus]APU12820.1 transcriptional regulator [Actinoalloteichus fjordicus]APU18792.1 transcriptional regulator [Actinoalloteichus sp. GBA129-24]